MNEDQIAIVQSIADSSLTLDHVKEAVLQAIADSRRLEDILSAAEDHRG